MLLDRTTRAGWKDALECAVAMVVRRNHNQLCCSIKFIAIMYFIHLQAYLVVLMKCYTCTELILVAMVMPQPQVCTCIYIVKQVTILHQHVHMYIIHIVTLFFLNEQEFILAISLVYLTVLRIRRFQVRILAWLP